MIFSHYRLWRAALVLALLLALALVPVTPARAATWTVTNANDSGPGSLRQAIADASSGDTIVFAPGLSGQTITLSSTLTISKDLTIDGSSLAIPVTISGNNSVRVFSVTSGTTVELKGLTIAHGNADIGGGVYNAGTLTITDCTFSNNQATANDGGGGGIFNTGTGTLTVTGSLFSNNQATSTAGVGGAILSLGPLTVTNSTFANNQVQQRGGGIYILNSSLTVTNSTFSDNQAGEGGGIYNLDSTLHLRNTILANSQGGGKDCFNDGGTLVEDTHNLIENNAASPNNCGTPTQTGDPNLGPLQDNGGPTQTMALGAGSPAIDNGDNAVCPATDQRGVARPQGIGCDIGAYEYEDLIPPTVVATSLLPSYTTGPTSFTVTFNENVNDPVGNTDPDDVTNPANYILVEAGANGLFDTASCRNGVQADD
ncbi:MAG: hypothetical protein D6770_07895, partial [Anaerolineae bacterium]